MCLWMSAPGSKVRQREGKTRRKRGIYEEGEKGEEEDIVKREEGGIEAEEKKGRGERGIGV